MTENRPTPDQTNAPSAFFVHALRHALRHLYDPDELRRSALLTLLPADERDGPSSLQRILVEAIEALKPKTTVSPQSHAWCTYYTLSARYIQQFQQSEVARDLALSPRQMRRRDSLAIRLLAGYLWTRYDLQHRCGAQGSSPTGQAASPPAAIPSREAELEWLERTGGSETVAVAEVLQALVRTAAPMAQALAVRLECVVPEGLPRLVAQVAALRQALLSVLTAAIRAVPGGQVEVAAEAAAGHVWIVLCALPPSALAGQIAEDQRENIDMARQLVALSGGSLTVTADQGGGPGFAARFSLPVAEQATVLVIEDNADTLQLYQRYLAGSRYAFFGAHSPEQALALAPKLAPHAVVLDVMLPGTDGWELLGRLREHPALRGVPIIVCTILPQEQLALTLGAAAFLRKPVSRTDLLAALDRLLRVGAVDA